MIHILEAAAIPFCALSKKKTGLYRVNVVSSPPLFIADSILADVPCEGLETPNGQNVLTDANNPDVLKALWTNDEEDIIGRHMGKVDRVTGSLFQSGKNGLIWYLRGEKNNTAVELVAHLSRFPLTDDRAVYLFREYDTLKYLSNLFSQIPVDPEHQFGIVEPLNYGTITINGFKYPFHLTPFVHLGELHVYYENTEAGEMVPSFNYAISYNDQMEVMRNRMIEIAENGGQEYQRIYEAQLYDLARMNGLIYRLSGRALHYTINAGDLLTSISEKGLCLALCATAGGLTTQLPEAEYIKFMTRQETNTFNIRLRRCAIRIFEEREDVIRKGLTYADQLLSRK